MHMYTNEQKGAVVPAWIRQKGGGGRGEESWATLLVAMKFIKTPNQLDFVPPQPGEPFPGETAWQAEGSSGTSVFRCPSGINVKNENIEPPAKTDGSTSYFWRRQSQLFAGIGPASQGFSPMVDNWYAANAERPTDANMTLGKNQTEWPMRVFWHDRAANRGEIKGGPITKISQIKKGSEIAMIFDGYQILDNKPDRISARHNRQKYTNFLFADGHAESIETARLPKVKEDFDAVDSVTRLAGYPHPKWRLDQ